MSFWNKNKEAAVGPVKEITVKGLTCDRCSAHVIKDLKATNEVLNVEIPSWKDGKTTITLKEGENLSDVKIEEIVQKAGYMVVSKTTESLTAIETPSDLDTDFLIIGTGGAGMGAAIEAARLGKKVTIIEKGTVGGCCVNIGCVPSKMMIKQANTVYHENHFVGIENQKITYNWEMLADEREKLVNTLRVEKYEKVIAEYPEITLINAIASFSKDSNNYPLVILDNGKTLKAEKYLIATGSKAILPAIEGINDVDVMTSTELLFTKKKPESVIVLGGGVIALELGQALHRLGVEVHSIEVRSRVLSSWDEDLTNEMTSYLKKEGIDIQAGSVPVRVFEQNGKKAVELENKQGERRIVEADEILVAIGRASNTDSLNLSDIGVEINPKTNGIKINEYGQTSHPAIYAGGDVADIPKLVYLAAKSGKVAANHAFGDKGETLDLSVVPDVVFTVPQLARVGLSENEAIVQGFEIKTANLDLSNVPKAIVSQKMDGLIKLVVDKKTNTMIGAHLMSENASDLIQTATMAVAMGKKHGFTIEQFREMLFPYLSEVEGLKLAAQMVDMDVAKFSCCAS